MKRGRCGLQRKSTLKEVECGFKEMLQPAPYKRNRVSPAHWWSLNCIYERDYRCFGIYVWAFAETLLSHLYCSVLKLLASLQKSWVRWIQYLSKLIKIDTFNQLLVKSLSVFLHVFNSRLISFDENTKCWHVCCTWQHHVYQRLSTIPMSQQQQKNELGDFIFSVVFCVSLCTAWIKSTLYLFVGIRRHTSDIQPIWRWVWKK